MDACSRPPRPGVTGALAGALVLQAVLSGEGLGPSSPYARGGAAPQIRGVEALDGKRVDPLEAADPQVVTVLVFTRSDCPISNRYAPEIERLRARFVPRGMRLWLVYVDPRQPASEVRAHLAEYGLRARVALDRRHELVQMTGATVTPEAAVFRHAPDGPMLVYRGRIDDRYIDFGRARPEPTRHDLGEAIQAALSGRAVTPATTQAVGCIIADLR